jgi:hypothetical protein
MTAPHPPTSPDGTPRKTDLNPTHVTAAALAAVTTAVLGSMLGIAGTLMGAAGASVITTVGTALYQSSLERSRERVRSLTQRTRPLRTSREGSSARVAPPRWGAVVVGALGAFLLAMMAITGFEWASGETVGGNGTGTTIGQVVTNQSGPQNPATPPTPHRPDAPASVTPTETSQPPDTPTSTPEDGGPRVVGPGVGQSPTRTSDRPAPSSAVTPTPPLLPTRLPGVGG